MLQICRQRVEEPTADELTELREKFTEHGFVHLHQIIEPDFCRNIVKATAEGDYAERHTPKIGSVEVCQLDKVQGMLNNAFSQPKVLKAVSQIFTDKRLDIFLGAIVRRIPGKNHFSRFHNDAASGMDIQGHPIERAVALSLNISVADFEGGELEIGYVPDGIQVNLDNADQLGKEIPLEHHHVVPNSGVGDALLFAISPRRYHRVRDVTAGGPRTVFVGWFYTVHPKES